MKLHELTMQHIGRRITVHSRYGFICGELREFNFQFERVSDYSRAGASYLSRVVMVVGEWSATLTPDTDFELN
jgi:hypothetical protein